MNKKAVAPLFIEDLEHVLDQTRELWEEIRGRSVFVTGGTGFFGMWLVESFLYINQALSLDATICVLTRDPDAYCIKAPHLVADPSLRIHKGDVRNFEFPDDCRFDYMIHAGTTSSAPVEPMEMFTTIVDGTKRVLEFAKFAGTRKFLFVSSGAVYGTQPPELTHIPEEYCGAPDVTLGTSAYGEGKRAGELLCTIAGTDSMECKIARCFAFVGPHLPLDAHFAIGNFIRDAITGKNISIKGDGRSVRSYLYAADLTVYLWKILFSGDRNRAYNVGSGEPLSIRELADRVIEAVDIVASVTIEKAIDKQYAYTRYVPSTNRIRNELGPIEEISLGESIRDTANWWKRQLGEWN